jgi:hypothetical protein
MKITDFKDKVVNSKFDNASKRHSELYNLCVNLVNLLMRLNTRIRSYVIYV